MVFNKGGKLIKSHKFYLSGKELEVVDQYQYLGVKLTHSGSMQLAVSELADKASRAWHGISNVIYTNKRMEVNKAFGIFDSLVVPVGTYCCEMWLPYILPEKSFKSFENLFNYWESLQCEKTNQQISRMQLSVHKKTSRLAVLGELGRYPLFIKTLSHCLNYKLSLLNKSSDT